MFKNLIRLITAAALVMSFAACTDATDNGPSTQDATAFGTLSDVFDVTGKTPSTVSYHYDSEDDTLSADVPGYDMGDFLTLTAVNAKVDASQTDVDYRKLFCYNIVAEDDYSFLTKNSVLSLANMLTGKYLYDAEYTDGEILVDGERKDPRNYFPSTDIAKGYDIKTAEDIELYRAITISLGSTDTVVITSEYVTTELS